MSSPQPPPAPDLLSGLPSPPPLPAPQEEGEEEEEVPGVAKQLANFGSI